MHSVTDGQTDGQRTVSCQEPIIERAGRSAKKHLCEICTDRAYREWRPWRPHPSRNPRQRGQRDRLMKAEGFAGSSAPTAAAGLHRRRRSTARGPAAGGLFRPGSPGCRRRPPKDAVASRTTPPSFWSRPPVAERWRHRDVIRRAPDLRSFTLACRYVARSTPIRTSSAHAILTENNLGHVRQRRKPEAVRDGWLWQTGNSLAPSAFGTLHSPEEKQPFSTRKWCHVTNNGDRRSSNMYQKCAPETCAE